MNENDWLAAQSRKSRREEPTTDPEPIVHRQDGIDPEHEALQADSVGLALLVVLETLAPAERLAFVLHDMFAVPLRRDRPHRRPLSGRGQATRQPRAPTGAGLAEAVWSAGGQPRVVFAFTVLDGKVASIELLSDPDPLRELELQIVATDVGEQWGGDTP